MSKDAVIDAGLLMLRAALETVIGTIFAAKVLNMPASELAVAGRNPPAVAKVKRILHAAPKS